MGRAHGLSSPSNAEDSDLLAEAAAWLQCAKLRLADLDVECLAELSRIRGIDFTTGLFHEAALRVETHADFFGRMRRADIVAMERPELVAVVPGAFYRNNRHSGADGARVIAIARELGCAAELIPIAGFGRIDDNARHIADWLTRRPERSIALASLSKGTCDVKRALARPDATRAFANVSLWVSFSGIVQGTPLISWLRARPLRWCGVRLLLALRRHPGATLHDLRHEPGSPLASWPALPPHLRILHVCGVPLRRHLQHRWASRAYDRLRPLGPNDGGGVLLGSLGNVPGIVCPVWGADHYLQPSWNATPLLRDIVVTALTPAFRQASQSAPSPIAAPAIKSTA